MEKRILGCTGSRITAHIFYPEKDNKKILLINSATGVKQQVYFSFARYFADEGFTVITYDYQGIGLSKPLSLRTCTASMRTWGTDDFRAVTDYVKTAFPGYTKYCLGHSVGALIMGMNQDSVIFRKLIFMATQDAFIGNLPAKAKWEAFFGFGILQPVITALLGYFPANRFGLGESLPKNCAYDWRTLILNTDSTNALLKKAQDYSKALTQDALVIWADDDRWLTEKGVKRLLETTYPHLTPVYRLIGKNESDHGRIGHINFFRSYNKKLWTFILNELN